MERPGAKKVRRDEVREMEKAETSEKVEKAGTVEKAEKVER